MKEISVKFTNQGQKLNGILHIPSRKTDSAIIFAYGFTGHKGEVQIVNCARKLTEEGFAVLRFDFRGTGDSDGLFRNMTISNEVSDLRKAIRFMKNKGYKKIGLVGHSLGGAVVILVDKKYVSSIVLWAPSIFPKKTFAKIFGNKIKELERKGNMIVSWGGKGIEFIIGKSLWEESKTKYPILIENLLSIKIPKTVIYGSDDWRWLKIVGSKELYKKLKQPSNNLKIIKGGDHTFSKYVHEKQLINYTVNWFNRWLK